MKQEIISVGEEKLPMKEIMNIILEIAEEIDSMSESGDLERCLRMLALLVELLLKYQMKSFILNWIIT